ncbi:MAG: hypothetical protein ACXAB7_18740 [Candidatus Kariarchaeaceae archaeon]
MPQSTYMLTYNSIIVKKQKQHNTHHRLMDDIDPELLSSVLDALIDEDPTSPILERINFGKQSFLIDLLSKHMRRTYWANANHNITSRPKICLFCESSCCNHITLSHKHTPIEEVLETATSSCQHPIEDDWLLDNTCIQCILEALKDIETPDDDPVVLIWDTFDYGNYVKWIIATNELSN